MALALVGGFLAQWLGSPLPWYVGPLLINAAFAVGGARVIGPDLLRPAALPVLGVVLGAAFLPQIFARVSEFAVALSLIPVFIIASTGVNYAYYRRIARQDVKTAYLASVPGGLTDMILMGEEARADVRQIALSHTLRVMVSVLGIVFLVVLASDAPSGTRDGADGWVGLTDLTVRDVMLLTLCALLGPWFGRVIRLPAPAILGALLLSAAIHLAGVVETGVPTLISRAGQLVLGASVGASFAGMRLGEAAQGLRHGLAAAGLSVVVSASIAVLAVALTGTDFFEALLSYAPGGLLEMSLLAHALDLSVAYVTVAHTLRYVLVMIGAVAMFKWLERAR